VQYQFCIEAFCGVTVQFMLCHSVGSLCNALSNVSELVGDFT
jgi:hypothetical protein